ncbi:TPA: hypothetical protein N0F65_007985 [Lagenidium giganteum]|uniref:Uncharacterized protein n=1 Tax=Lagenidium giganteum TaxID=4803 RepID=A0AAV2YMX5_9STRA|nr:TPA: hypothetical protein N0F65_007985 [Lagenidium giganteum]
MKPVGTPTSYDDEESPDVDDVRMVSEALGTLMWIANSTRPDISFAVNTVARHRERPKQCLWELIKRILRYLRGTEKHGIVY